MCRTVLLEGVFLNLNQYGSIWWIIFFRSMCLINPHNHPRTRLKKNTHAYAPDTNQLQSIPILNEPTPAPKHVANIYYCSLICLRTSAYANCLQLKSNVTSTVLSLDLRLRNGPRLRRVFFPPLKKWTISVNFSDFMNFWCSKIQNKRPQGGAIIRILILTFSFSD